MAQCKEVVLLNLIAHDILDQRLRGARRRALGVGVLDAPELVVAGINVRRGRLEAVNADGRDSGGVLRDEAEGHIADGAWRTLDRLEHGSRRLLGQGVAGGLRGATENILLEGSAGARGRRAIDDGNRLVGATNLAPV